MGQMMISGTLGLLFSEKNMMKTYENNSNQGTSFTKPFQQSSHQWRVHASATTITQAMDLMHVYPGIPVSGCQTGYIFNFSMFHHISTPTYAVFLETYPKIALGRTKKDNKRTRFNTLQHGSAMFSQPSGALNGAKQPPSKCFGSDKARPKISGGDVLSTMMRKADPLVPLKSSNVISFFRASTPSPSNLVKGTQDKEHSPGIRYVPMVFPQY